MRNRKPNRSGSGHAVCFLASILTAAGAAFAGDSTSASIKVKDDGQMCEVENQLTECATLPDVLTQEFGFDRNIQLTVSPEGCGESALGRVRVVADKLKAAGFSRVTLVGFLSQPNSKCTH